MEPPKTYPGVKYKEVNNMQNFDVNNEAKFFEKLMQESKEIQKQQDEKCKSCSYGICDECKVTRGER